MPGGNTQAELWVQFAVVAIVAMVTTLVAVGFFKLWKDLKSWITEQNARIDSEREKQDKARADEREKQRVWETEQMRNRDEQWQAFLKTMQAQWLETDKRSNEVMRELVDKINHLTLSVQDHDTWARASNGSAGMEPNTRRRKTA